MVIIYGLLSITFITFITFLLRVAPLWRQRHLGVDAYYFLLTAEEFKKQKRIPIKLPPYYLLDVEEQWYPPGFSVFLGLLPNKFLYRSYWLISPILDALNLAVLLVFIYLQTFSLEGLFLAGIVYALTPILITETTTLTSRPLGNLLLTGEILSLALYFQEDSILFLILAVIFGFTIFASHKMSTQFLCFFYVCLTIVIQSIIPLVILILAFIISLIILRGYFFKILKNYQDGIVFWHRNWNYLGAHQVYNSPVYTRNRKSSENNTYTPRKHHIYTALDYLNKIKSSIFTKNKAAYFFLRGIFGKDGNPFIVFVLLSSLWIFGTLAPIEKLIFLWAFLAFVWMLLTIFVPYLRLLGEGFKYMRMSAFPAAYIISLSFTSSNVSRLGIVLVALILLFSVGRWFLTLSELSRTNHTPSILNEEPALEKMFEYIKKNPEVDYIACFSVDLADSLVYNCRRHVLWGTHHNCMNSKVVDFFPVLRKPLKWFKEQYGIKYILVDTAYVRPQDLELEKNSIVKQFGQYVLYRFNS